jgi:transposase
LLLDEAGHRVGSRRVAHSQEGLEDLKHFLLSITSDPEHLACIVETTQGLLITFLLEAGFPVYPVNPKTINPRRKASGAKTDQIDAYLLAKVGRFELADLRRLEPERASVQELKTLTRDQDALIQTQTRLINQLTACLKNYYPAALKLFTKLRHRSTLLFLQTYPTPQAVQAASLADLAAALRRGKHSNPTRAARKIAAEVHRPQLTANDITVRTKSRLMLSLIKQLLVVMQDVAAYDEEIGTFFLSQEDHTIFASLPGAGPRLAPRLLSEWGDDRVRSADAGSVQALAGTAPVPFQRGNYAKAHKRLACLKPLRNVLSQFARATTRKARLGTRLLSAETGRGQESQDGRARLSQ